MTFIQSQQTAWETGLDRKAWRGLVNAVWSLESHSGFLDKLELGRWISSPRRYEGRTQDPPSEDNVEQE